jgi:ribosomal protein L27
MSSTVFPNGIISDSINASVSGSSIDMNNCELTSVRCETPSSTDSVANKEYVDDQRLDAKKSIRGKNLIINGEMIVSQRGSSFVSVSSGDYTLDRWSYSATDTSGVVDITQDTDKPTIVADGAFTYFNNSLKVDVTTADASMDAGDTSLILYKLEGYDMYPIYKSNEFTLSFWVKSNKTGTYCVSFKNSASDRSYISTYSISQADTWEKKTVTVDFLDASGGTWNLTDGTGLAIHFMLMCGSTYQNTADTWHDGNYLATSSQTNLLDNTSNYFNLTGVQLEIGNEATYYDHIGYGETLRRCERYFQLISAASNSTNYMTFAHGYTGGGSTTSVTVFGFRLREKMRDAPVLVSPAASQFQVYDLAGAATVCSNVSIVGASEDVLNFSFVTAGGLTGNQPYFCQAANNVTAYMGFDAEI